MSSNQQTYKIPSTQELVTLSAMTLQDEKVRLSNTNYIMSMISIINRRIQENTPENLAIDIGEYPLTDLQYLIYQLRILTYGPIYDLSFTCPSCGNQVKDQVDLNELQLKDTNSELHFDIGPLPVSKDVLSCKLMSARDFVRVAEETDNIRVKYPDYEGDPSMTLMYAAKIESVNKKKLPGYQLNDYVDNMHARDALYFDRKYAEIADGGLDLQRSVRCPSCGSIVPYELPITEEFWTPSDLD